MRLIAGYQAPRRAAPVSRLRRHRGHVFDRTTRGAVARWSTVLAIAFVLDLAAPTILLRG
jgi:hypothetical protein